MAKNKKTGIFRTVAHADQNEQLFVSYTDEKTFNKAMQGRNNAEGQLVERSQAGYYRSFVDIVPNTTVRSPFTREDYSFFRPTERVPRKQKEIMAYCMTAYEKVGIVKNIIDLMADFSCQGIKLVHKDPKAQKRFNKWWDKVRGVDRSERFLNVLYRVGNVIIKRSTGKVTKKQSKDFNFSVANELSPGNSKVIEHYVAARQDLGLKTENKDNIEKTQAADMKVGPDQRLIDGDLPVKYTFLNPLLVDMIEPELSLFIGQPLYGITLSPTILRKIRSPTTALENSLVGRLPKDIVAATKDHDLKILPLHPNNIQVYHYKKDDWLIWANPLTYCILDDLIQLEKAKLADLAALDGIISNVRLWKLGDLEHKILPTKNAISKLANILQSNVGGGSFDLIWGPEIELVESKADFSKFLTAEKYTSILNQIYAGLGVPQALTGSQDKQGGFTNNFVSLKVLTDRLEYGRKILVSFWKKEIDLVTKAFGYDEPAHIHFDKISMTDENAEKALLIQLVDRGIISIETLIERYGEIPEIEKIRMEREEKERKDGTLGPKSGPYHNNQLYNDLLKIFAQQGAVTPSECGLELEDNKDGEVSVLDKKMEQEKDLTTKQMNINKLKLNNPGNLGNSPKPKGRPGQGRPTNKKDSKKRKQKTVKPRSKMRVKKAVANSADFISKYTWATAAQKAIADILNIPLLNFYNKKDLRSLTSEEAAKCEKIKFGVLNNLESYQKVDEKTILDLFKRKTIGVDRKIDYIRKELLAEVTKRSGCEPTLDIQRQAQSMAFALLK